MSDVTNLTEFRGPQNSDLALLRAKAADLRLELNAQFVALCATLDKAVEAGITVEFSFTRAPGQAWQYTSKVYKEL